MLFNPAHTVLNQRANARRASIETTNLIGHWDPNDSDSYGGSGTTYNNLVSAKEDLKIYGATFVGSAQPYHFTFDGTNDKIADIDTSDPYNDNFEIRVQYSWAISMWVKFSSFSTNLLWALGPSTEYVKCYMTAYGDGSTNKPSVYCDTTETHPPSLSTGEWYMVTWRRRSVEATSASIIDIFYDGVLQKSMHLDTDCVCENNWGNRYAVLAAVGAQDFDIGFHEADEDYINSATKLGAILVYEEAGDNCLPNSAIWSNYLATKGGEGSGGPWSYK